MSEEIVQFKVDLADTASQFRHYYEVCVGGGHAALALRADWRSHMRKCRDELGFQYVRFHGLLGDDMSVCLGSPEHPEHHFYNVDLIFDFLLEIGMRPFIGLSFMPTPLASGTRTVFHYRGNATPPRDFGQWEDLVRDLARHLAGRYGREEVANWYFEVWNEPNLEHFWAGTQEQYFQLYRHSATAVKFVDPNFRVGGPATARNGWVAEFIEFCTKQGVPLDFVSTHHYPTEAAVAPDLAMEDQMAASPRGILTKWVKETRAHAGTLPLHYTEWNTSPSSRDPYHDDPYAAAFILKTIADNDGLVDTYSFWTFSDIFEEVGFPSQPFHGGLGLLSIGGIEKPSYHAFRFLHDLGQERLPVEGAGRTVEAMAVSSGPKTHVLFWNYDVPRSGIRPSHVRLTIVRTGGRVKAVLERVDADHANAKAAWERMGRPHYLTRDEVEKLRRAAAVKTEALRVQGSEEEQVVEFTLPPFGIARLTLSPAEE
jgi:xylan 1,4-beta-xylosidase